MGFLDIHVVEKLLRDARAAPIEDGSREVPGLAAGRTIARRCGAA